MSRNSQSPQDGQAAIHKNEPAAMESERVLVVPQHGEAGSDSHSLHHLRQCDEDETAGAEPSAAVAYEKEEEEEEDCSDSQEFETPSQTTSGHYSDQSADMPNTPNNDVVESKERDNEDCQKNEQIEEVTNGDSKPDDELVDEDNLKPDDAMIDEEHPDPDDAMVDEEHPNPDDAVVDEEHPYPDDAVVGEEHPHPDDAVVDEEHPHPDNAMVDEEHPHPDDAIVDEDYQLDDNESHASTQLPCEYDNQGNDDFRQAQPEEEEQTSMEADDENTVRRSMELEM